VDTLSYTDAALASKIVLNAVLSGEKISTINVGSGEHISLLALYNMVMERCTEERVKPFICSPSKQSRTLVCDNSLLKSLGWEQTVSIEDEISNIVQL
jgi:nucleoside-diphosphate-sugar epimerase